MILTVTANTAIDHIVFVDQWTENATLRATQTLQSMAGKPTDAAWVLGEMGIPSHALGFTAGPTGQFIAAELARKGVTTDFIEVGGESRRNLVIVYPGGQTTITAASLCVTPAHVAALVQRYAAALDTASCVVLGGTLPAGMDPAFYTQIIRQARQRGIPVIFDASEPYLSAGLAGAPSIVKPNRDELGQFLGRPVASVADAEAAGQIIRQRYGATPIITLGAEGGLALLPEGTYRIAALPVPVVSTAGAGDAILAGLAAAIARGEPIIEGLRLGFAAAAAVITQPGTAQCHREDIERYRQQIEITPYMGGKEDDHV